MDLLASQRWLCASLLALSACDLLNGAADDGDEGGGIGLVRDETGGDTRDGDATLLAEQLSRAKKRLRFIGKGSEHLGWKLSALSKMYSLAGAVEVPGWSPQGEGEIRQTRDDDLRTAWTCEYSRDSPCAFGIHFPEAAMVTAIRVNASPNGADDPSRFGRVRTLRVHTAEGWAEDHVLATYEDLYIRLGEPVLTRNLTIEVMDTQSKNATLLRIADFDVYGTAGQQRSPIKLDPASLYLRLPSPLWKKTGGEQRLTPPQLVYGAAQSDPKMLALGSAAYASGARMLLIEQLTETKCKSHVGNYVMLDLKTRVRVPLGDMGGIPGDVWRQKEDRGFAVGYVDEDRSRVHAFLLDDGSYQRKKSLRASRDTYHEVFERWGVDETPLPRGGGTVQDPPAGCEPASSEDFARLEAAHPATQAETPAGSRGKKKKKKKNKKRRGKPSRLGGPADRWLSCEFADGVKAFISTGESCGSRFEIAVIDAQGHQVARHGDARNSARARVRRVNDQQVLVEVAGKGGEVELFWVSPTAIESAGMGTALALSPPSACRAQCDTPFVNPRAQ